jgi:hypothetical protein
MGFEPPPIARDRLRLVRTTTPDPLLRRDLSTALEEARMSTSFMPSHDLLQDVVQCTTCVQTDDRKGREGLCARHRARWNLEMCMATTEDRMGESYLDSLMQTVLASDHGSVQLLAALDRQLRALEVVWEAHQRGAAQLPATVADAVARARFDIPDFLPGKTEAIQQAS